MPTLAQPSEPVCSTGAGAEELMLAESQGNGAEAHRLSALADEVLDHWSQRAEVLMESAGFDEHLDYEHVLPGPSYVVKVRYKAMGRLQPRKFRLDD